MSGAAGKSLMAANTAIGLMLVVLFAVLASFFSFIIYLARRSRRFSAENEIDSKPA
jgi:maltodextrin utilization protein YvdJ